MLVTPSSAEKGSFLARTGKQVAVDERYATWIGAIVENGVEGWSVGDEVQAVDFRGPRGTSNCSVTGFTSITRGVPHFGHLTSGPDNGPPESPGCGSPAAFAELDCDYFSADSGHVGWAYGKPRVAPVVYESREIDEPAVLKATARLLEENAYFVQQVTRLQGAAAGMNAQLQTEHALRVFRSGATAYWLLESKFWTGEGQRECGGNDIAEKYFTVISDRGGSPGEIMLGPSAYERKIRDLVDVDADGLPELLEEHEFSTGLIVESLDFERRELRRVCQDTIAFCDCGC